MNTSDTTNTNDAENNATLSNAIEPTWLLKTGSAPKLGKHAEGDISYQILTDSSRAEPMIRIIGNDGGGYYSKEVLPFRNVEVCIDKHELDQPLPSKLFQPAFTGKSSNNAGFLAAILRAERLLSAAPEVEGRHIIAGNWAEWKTSLLALPGLLIETNAAPEKETSKNGKGAADSEVSNAAETSRRKK